MLILYSKTASNHKSKQNKTANLGDVETMTTRATTLLKSNAQFSTKIISQGTHTETRKYDLFKGTNKPTETVLEKDKIVGLPDKDFKMFFLKMLKELMKVCRKSRKVCKNKI